MAGRKKLTAKPGAWSPKPKSYGYTWLRNGKKIKGAKGATYKVIEADKRKQLQVRVTAKRPGYANKSATSASKRIK